MQLKGQYWKVQIVPSIAAPLHGTNSLVRGSRAGKKGCRLAYWKPSVSVVDSLHYNDALPDAQKK